VRSAVGAGAAASLVPGPFSRAVRDPGTAAADLAAAAADLAAAAAPAAATWRPPLHIFLTSHQKLQRKQVGNPSAVCQGGCPADCQGQSVAPVLLIEYAGHVNF
jgi:hypothetical protein